MRRFFTEPDNIKDGLIEIKEDAAHISRVLRMEKGDAVVVFDGSGAEYEAEIVEIDGGLIRAEIKAEQRTACEPKIRVTLFQGIPKAGKLETVVQKAVELGAAGIVPFRADRSVARIPDGPKGEQKIARLNKIAREAAKQCGRGVVPEVAASVSIDGMIDMIKNLDMAVMLYEELGHAGEKNLKSVLSRPAESIGVVIGPEGGFSAAEAERLTALPNVYAAGLGPRILRTETAGMAALAVIMYEKNEI